MFWRTKTVFGLNIKHDISLYSGIYRKHRASFTGCPHECRQTLMFVALFHFPIHDVTARKNFTIQLSFRLPHPNALVKFSESTELLRQADLYGGLSSLSKEKMQCGNFFYRSRQTPHALCAVGALPTGVRHLWWRLRLARSRPRFRARRLCNIDLYLLHQPALQGLARATARHGVSRALAEVVRPTARRAWASYRKR